MRPSCPRYVLDSGLPVLGICYGMQLLAHNLGGRVAPAQRREYGPALLQVTDLACPLFAELPFALPVWMSHGDRIEALPPGFAVVAQTDNSPIAAMAHPGRRLYGLQFHPEVVHTPQGADILRNFLCTASAGCAAPGRPAHFIGEAVDAIRRQVGERPGALRPVRRRRLGGGRRRWSTAPSATSSPASLSTTACCARASRSRSSSTFEQEQGHAPGGRPRRRGVPGRAGRRHRPGGKAAHHRREVRAHLRARGPPPGPFRLSGPGHDLPRRHRERRGRAARAPSASRPTTTSAACPTTCSWSWSSRCAFCSRTRCEPWATSWACPTRSSSASPSPGRAWPCASWAR